MSAAPPGWQYIYFGAAFGALICASAWPAVPRWGRPAIGLLAIVALAANAIALVAWALALPTFMATIDPLCLACWGS